MPAYNDELKSFSPGAILMKNIVKESFDNGLGVFDFLPGNEIYKLRWSNSKFDIYEYIKPISIRGFLFFIFLKMKTYFKKNSKIKNILYFIKRRYNKLK